MRTLDKAEAWLQNLKSVPGLGKLASFVLEELRRLRQIVAAVSSYRLRKYTALRKLEDCLPVELDHHNEHMAWGIQEAMKLLRNEDALQAKQSSPTDN